MKAVLLPRERFTLAPATFAELVVWRVPRPVIGSTHTTSDRLLRNAEVGFAQAPRGLAIRIPEEIFRNSYHSFKYRLALVVEERCVLRYDNEAGKGDHKNVGTEELPSAFTSVTNLLTAFWRDVEAWRRS